MRKKGLTVLETLLSIAIVGIVSVILMEFYASMTQSYLFARFFMEDALNAQMALERFIAEAKLSKPGEFTLINTHEVNFTAYFDDGTTKEIRYKLDDEKIKRKLNTDTTYEILLDNVDRFEIGQGKDINNNNLDRFYKVYITINGRENYKIRFRSGLCLMN